MGNSPVAGKRTSSVFFGCGVPGVVSLVGVGEAGVTIPVGVSVGVAVGVSVGGSVAVTVSVPVGVVVGVGDGVLVMISNLEAVAPCGRAKSTAASVRAATTRMGRNFFDMVIPPVNQF